MYRSVFRFTYRLMFVPLVCLLSCASSAQAGPLRVALVLSEEGGSYQAFSESLSSKLPSNNFVLTRQRADDAPGAYDLYIAVGMEAASKLATRGVPTLNILVPKAGYDSLLHGDSKHSSQRSGIYLDQPIERQVALMLAALPDTRQVGVLYTAPPPELQNVRHLLAGKNIRLHDRVVDDSHPLNDALGNLLAESEVIFVLADADVYNAGTIRNILLAAYRKQIPMVGASQAFVKAGALCAIYTSPEQYAEQAASMIRQYAVSGKLPAAQYPSDYEVLVNIQVERSLDLHIKDADQLRREIGRVP